jgi:Ca2+/Na+ antiporter
LQAFWRPNLLFGILVEFFFIFSLFFRFFSRWNGFLIVKWLICLVLFMRVLVPLLSGLEKEKVFLDSVVVADEVVLLQIVDKEFVSLAGSAMGELRQSRLIMEKIKKFIVSKKKKCVELTEWGSTIQKIVSVALLRNVDKVFFVEQRNQFFENILEELKKKRLKFEVVPVVGEDGEEKK